MDAKYVVEVPCDLTGWVSHAQRDKAIGKSKRLDTLWDSGGPGWERFYVKETEKGPEVWEARLTRFFPNEKGKPGEVCWLILARNALTGEKKYFYSNAPKETAPETLLKVAFSRWHIERIFQDGKQEVGMNHFEVRKWLAIKRHLILTMVSFLFLAKATDRLRGEKRTHLVVSSPGGG